MKFRPKGLSMLPHQRLFQSQTLHLESFAQTRSVAGTVVWIQPDIDKILGHLQESSREGVSQRRSTGHIAWKECQYRL